ncbi:MAG: hypothetical protein ACIAQU_02355 [Phycisphaerales bacterium JB064]
MRCRRAIRTLLVFVLLGAVAMVLTSWGIHGWHRWRMERAGTNAVWSDDDTKIVHRLDKPSIHFSAPPWSTHRRIPEAHALARGEGFPMGGVTQRERFGWRRDSWDVAVIQFASPDGDDPERPGASWESLVVIRVGWPIHALGLGAYSGAFGHYEPSPSPGRTRYDAFTRTPALSLRGGLAPAPWPTRPDWPATSGLTGHDSLDRFALPLLPLWPGFLINTFFYALLLFIAWRTPILIRRTLRRRCGRCLGCGYNRDGLEPHAACPECGAVVGHAARGAAVAG